MRDEFSPESWRAHPLLRGNLPKGWAYIAIEDVSKDVNSGYSSGDHNSNGKGITHLRPMNINRDGQIDLSVVKSVPDNDGPTLSDADILFNNTNSPDLVGKTAIILKSHIGFGFSNHMTRVRLESGVNAVFIARQLHFLWMTGYMKARCTNHVNQASISSKALATTVPILLPPRAEQSRIVAKLEALLSDLDAGVAELKVAQKKLTQYRQSLLKAAVEGALTAEWRAKNKPKETGAQLLARILKERRARWEAKQLAKFAEQGKTPPKDWKDKYVEPVKPDTEGLPELPQGWVWASVEQVSEIQGGIQKQPSRIPIKNKFPFLRVANVARGRLVLDEIHEIELHPGELERLSLKKEDVLIVEGNGSLSEIGRCAVWDGSIPNAVHQNHLIRARPILLNGSFVESWLNSSGGIEKLTTLAATSSGLYTLSVSKIAKIPIPIPPLEEQMVAMNLLQTLIDADHSQNSDVTLLLQKSSAQRQNILRAAFSGQLVPQDPNDEPASVLLERIRAERAEREGNIGKAKGRKTRMVTSSKSVRTQRRGRPRKQPA